MRIAVDKNSYQVAKNDGNEYIYIYNDESLQDLMKTKLLCQEWYEIGSVDINTTDYILDCKKKCKVTDKDWNILPPYKEHKIGIIVPNYNYAHTIKLCLDSIEKQTYKNYQVVFVDDCSTDNSVEIAESYKDRINIEIVKLKQKRLNGGSRNEGYLHLQDDVDYIYYIDSDDWFYDENCLQKINDKLQSEPDVLFVGLAKFKDNKTEQIHIPAYMDRYQAMEGWSGSCGKVIKRTLATRQECLFNEGTLKEDRNQHRKICIYMKDFALLKDPIYVWNQTNTKSVTTIRDQAVWGTSTIRHYADLKQLYLTVKGQDETTDQILKWALYRSLKEIMEGGDKQW